MASLHARRKHPAQSDGDINIIIDTPSTPHKTKKSKFTHIFFRLRDAHVAVIIFGLFVFVGVVLGTLVLHHTHRKVIFHTMRNPWAHGRAAIRHLTRRQHPQGFHHHFYSGAPLFVTVLIPSVVNPLGRQQRLQAIHDAWGPFGRAIYVLHNITEFPPAASYQTITENRKPWDRYLYPQNLLLPESIGVDDGVPRLMHTIRTIHDHVDPDFVFMANDHTYVIPSHLCHYLQDKNPAVDLYAGHALKNKDDLFNSGAAGYILSRKTMSKLIEKWDKKDPHCVVETGQEGHPNMKWLQGNPGLLTVSCLTSMGIRAIDTREKGKFHRFHAFPLVRLVTGLVDDWYIRKHQLDTLPTNPFDESYATLLDGPDCCSKETISFHYVEAMEQKALFHVQNALLNTAMSNAELKKLMMEQWPSTKKEIGAYSHGLPKLDDDIRWSRLLQTVRKLSSRDTQGGDC